MIQISVFFTRWTLEETPAFEEKIEEEFIQIQRPRENPRFNATFVRQSTEPRASTLWLILRQKREYNMLHTAESPINSGFAVFDVFFFNAVMR